MNLTVAEWHNRLGLKGRTNYVVPLEITNWREDQLLEPDPLEDQFDILNVEFWESLEPHEDTEQESFHLVTGA